MGIELVHVGGAGEYPQAQLEALDALIAYIDAYYGFESAVTDHKAWRSGNSDTSPEFAAYLNNYQTTRTHDGGRLRLRLARVRRRKTVAFPSKRCAFCANACMLAGRAAA